MSDGIGYVIGCLFSILLWKVDRMKIAVDIHRWISKLIKNKVLLQFIYIAVILAIIIIFRDIENNEIYNFITAFLVVDISNTERKNLRCKEKTHFYDSISLISKSLLCGFIAPLFYIIFFGNNFAMVYMLVFNLNGIGDFILIKVFFVMLSIVPSFLAQIFLYIVYICRNRKFNIDFKGDYIVNSFTRPLLNIDILGAYIESVNFYYYYNTKELHYIKSYGEYRNKIDHICIKDYLSISYGICIVYFIAFFIMQYIF